MLTDSEIQVLRDLSMQISAPINEYIIQDICERIAASGKFTATADYMAYRAEALGLHWKALRKEIAKRLKIAESEVDRLYEIAAQRTYADDVRRLQSEYSSFTDNPAIRQITRAARDVAAEELINITRTMGMVDPVGRELPLKEFYGKTMDFVFNNVSYGAMDYNTAVRLASARLAEKGVTVVGYGSGAKTSLEAAVRRNIMGGLGLMVERISHYNHDALGADGWEMSAHAMSAPDHEPYQGKQYTDAEWIKLNGLPPKTGDPPDKPEIQGELKRRVGTLNCGHNAFPIIVGVNQPQYTEEELEKFRDDNAKGVTVDGKHYALYESAQHQRGLERRIRYWRRQDLSAHSSGDSDRLIQTRGKLISLNREYKEFSKSAGFRTQEERLHVSGFGSRQGAAIERKISSFGALEGTKTSTGRAVSGVSEHFGVRAVQREVSVAGVRDALQSPLKIGKIRADGSQQFIGESATVAINADTGKLVTAWKTGAGARKKWGGKK